HVLAGIAVGRPEKQGDAVVKKFFPVGKLPVQGGVAFGLGHLFAAVHGAEHLLRNAEALRPRQPHHRDASLAGGRRHGSNGAVFQHRISPPSPARSAGQVCCCVYCTTFGRKKERRPRGLFSTFFKENVENSVPSPRPQAAKKKPLLFPTGKAGAHVTKRYLLADEPRVP